jgi:hypothetical protein
VSATPVAVRPLADNKKAAEIRGFILGIGGAEDHETSIHRSAPIDNISSLFQQFIEISVYP